MVQSVTDRCSTIGVLSALGCSNKQISKIFLIKSFLIGIIIFLFALIFTWIACLALKAWFLSAFRLNVHVIEFKIKTTLILMGVILLFSLLEAMLPTLKILKNRPLDNIKC